MPPTCSTNTMLNLRRPDPPPMQQNAASPIQRVPADVLGCIFEAALESNHWYLHDRGEYRMASSDYHTRAILPPIIVQVCRSWHNVACRMASLWRFILLNLQATPQSIRMAEVFICRSRNAELAVEFWLPENSRDMPKVNSEMATILVQNAHRIRALYIGVASECYTALPSFRASLVQLHTLKFYGRGSASREWIEFLAGLPVNSVGMSLWRVPSSPHEIHSFMGLSTLAISVDLQHNVDESHRLHLPHITTLTLECSGSEFDPHHIFDALSAPSLTTLTVVALHNATTVSDWLGRHTQLSTLRVVGAKIKAAQVAQIMRAAPRLQEFVFRRGLPHSILDGLLAEMSLTNATPLLPQLRHLTIDGWYMFTSEALVKMLESRADSLSHIELVFSPGRMLDPTLLARVQALRIPTLLEEQKNKYR
ncbi:hypothetical protein MKEN_00934200 [Mycena kentingensis (nom. inval.)]|nr:hypothetical protein MKEN_00934200 [Mycena kentingensis (nom. inval.)]